MGYLADIKVTDTKFKLYTRRVECYPENSAFKRARFEPGDDVIELDLNFEWCYEGHKPISYEFRNSQGFYFELAINPAEAILEQAEKSGTIDNFELQGGDCPIYLDLSGMRDNYLSGEEKAYDKSSLVHYYKKADLYCSRDEVRAMRHGYFNSFCYGDYIIQILIGLSERDIECLYNLINKEMRSGHFTVHATPDCYQVNYRKMKQHQIEYMFANRSRRVDAVLKSLSEPKIDTAAQGIRVKFRVTDFCDQYIKGSGRINLNTFFSQVDFYLSKVYSPFQFDSRWRRLEDDDLECDFLITKDWKEFYEKYIY